MLNVAHHKSDSFSVVYQAGDSIASLETALLEAIANQRGIALDQLEINTIDYGDEGPQRIIKEKDAPAILTRFNPLHPVRATHPNHHNLDLCSILQK